MLTPQINAHLKTDYSDLRIVNDAGKWVPHLLRLPNAENHIASVVIDLPFIKRENITGFTELTIRSDTTKISNLLLSFKNADAERYGSITGSDDAKNWFTINDSILIRPFKNLTNSTASFTLHFPAVNYTYYKINIFNKDKAPLNILSIGYQTLAKAPGIAAIHPPIENPGTSLSQKDSGSFSFIKIVQGASYHFNELHVATSGVQYFNRKADVYIPNIANHSFSNPGQLVQSFTLSKNSTLQYQTPVCNAAVFYLMIHNEDNLPLKFTHIKTFCSYRIATAYLEKETSYKLMMDNVNAMPASYDLLLQNIPDKENIRVVSTGNVEAINQVLTTEAIPKNQRMIWLVIGVAAAVLVFFTYKLIREMNKQKI